MTKQPILDELHAIREQLLADSGGTLETLVARLQEEQKASGRVVIETSRTKHGILHRERLSQPSTTNQAPSTE